MALRKKKSSPKIRSPRKVSGGSLQDTLLWIGSNAQQWLQQHLDVKTDILGELLALLDLARDAVIVLDRRERIVFWNHGAELLYGIRKEDAYDKPAKALYSGSAERSLEDVKRGCLRHGTWEGELSYQRRDGAVRIIRSRATVQQTPDGVIMAILLINSDITEQYHIEQALATERNFVNSLVDTAQTIVLVVGTDGRIVMVNPYFEKLTGYFQNEVKGKPWVDMFIPEQNREEVARLLGQPASVQEGRGSIQPILTKSGAIIHVEWYDRLLHGQQGESVGILLTGQDVTHRLRVESELRDNETKYRTLLMNLPGVPYRVNPGDNGIIEFVSEGISELTGYPAEMFNSRPVSVFFDLIYPEDRELVSALVDKQIQVQQWYEAEFRLIHASGRMVWVRDRGRQLADESGAAKYLDGVLFDISEHKQLVLKVQADEVRFYELFNHMSSGVAVFDASGDSADFVFKDINQSGAKIYRLNRQDIVGKMASEILPGARAMGLIDKLQEVCRTGQPVHLPVVQYQDERFTFWSENYIYRLPSGEIVLVFDDVTARKQAEIELRRSEEKYRSLLNSMHEGVWVLNTQGITIYVNPCMAEMLGYREVEVLGHSVFEFIDSSMHDYMGQLLQRRKENIREQYELDIRRPDGSMIYTWVDAAPWYDVNGGIGGSIGVIADISERRKAEAALRESEERYRSLYSNMIEIVVLHEVVYSEDGIPADYRIIDCNPAFSRELGIPREQAVGHLASEVYGVPSAPYLQEYSAVAAGADALMFETYFAPMGKYFLISVFSVKRGTFATVSADVSVRRKAEESLRATNRRLEDIIEFLPDPTFVVNARQEIMSWNKAIEEMTGVAKSEILGRGPAECSGVFYDKPRQMLFELFFHEGIDLDAQRYSYVKRQKNLLYAEIFLPKLNKGKGAFVWIKACPLYDADGALSGVIESVRDITEQKQAEAILKKDRDLFEQLVNEKTVELLLIQKELVEAKHLSDIGALAATVAHELRNPLAAIRTAAYNISKKSGNDALYAGHLTNIDKKVAESDQIINNLLSYSRIKSPHYESVKIKEIVDECVEAAVERFPGWSVEIGREGKLGAQEAINADPLQMRELFNNILNNAFESLPDKKGKITVFQEFVAGKKVVLRFSDNGGGISPDDLKKVSQPFFTTKTKGTGLGLTVCHQLVRLHNGTIVLDSTLGQGTSVTITLPVAQA